MLPDIQLLKPEIPIDLTRVGAKGIRKLVKVSRKDKRPIILIATFEAFVNLPSYLKGVSLSRNFEVIDEVIESLTAKPIENIEDLVIEIAENLLEKHEYATRSEVSMVADFIMRKKTPKSGQRTQEVVKIFSDAVASRDGKKIVFVGAEVSGITVCPCAQELAKSRAMERLREMGYGEKEIMKIISAVPIASHNQRGRARIKVQIREDFRVSIMNLIEIAKSAMSFETFEILKREDELEVVENAHQNPMFVEDSVRKIALEFIKAYPNAPDDVMVMIMQENEESIHQHNVVAEKIATVGELRRELNS
uniref:GTP cyclohydrolase MptA n=1 Tax=Archaeoglobus fulgidus TaxID=2234 RepID=A0A7J2TJL9_ARCFL